MNRFEQAEEFERIRQEVWKIAEDLLGLADRCESCNRRKAEDDLREIINSIEDWTRWQ